MCTVNAKQTGPQCTMIKDLIRIISSPNYKRLLLVLYSCLIWWSASLPWTIQSAPSMNHKHFHQMEVGEHVYHIIAINFAHFYLQEATWSSAQWDLATSNFASLRSKTLLPGFFPSCWKQSLMKCLKMENTCSCNLSSVSAALCPRSGPAALSAGLASWSSDEMSALVLFVWDHCWVQNENSNA